MFKYNWLSFERPWANKSHLKVGDWTTREATNVDDIASSDSYQFQKNQKRPF